MTYDEILKLPETQRLVKVTEMLQGLEKDAVETARRIALMQTPHPREVAQQWEPVIAEGVQELSKAQKVLRKVRTRARARPGQWMTGKPGNGLLRALVDVSTALAGFLVRLQAMQTEVRSLEMLGLVRSSILNELPRADRQAILQEAHQAQLEAADG